MKVLVTGANGQLGQCIQDVAKKHTEITWFFESSTTLDVTSKVVVEGFFRQHQPDVVINCAAYTAVDKAEEEPDKAYLINAEAVNYIAENCLANNTRLIHISTDFVFDGSSKIPYTPDATTQPLGVYGTSKLKGEEYIQQQLQNYCIVRTSWVYSNHGNNFMKTMLRLAASRTEISVVNDQIGCPTNAHDLAAFLVAEVITSKNTGVFHYSNQGEISWYTFAKAIFEVAKKEITVHPIPSSQYPTPAKRPTYSVLDCSKTIESFGVQIPNWKESLERCLN